LGDRIAYAPTVEEATQGANVLALLTEWPEFRELDLAHLGGLMVRKSIVDCRNLLSPKAAQSHGFSYVSIGRAAV